MDEEINFSKLSVWIDWLYEQATSGGHHFDSSRTLADSYLDLSPSTMDAATSLVNWESTKSASCGFMTGLGGVVALPFTLPMSMTGNLLIQLRMIAAVAIIGGHSVEDIRIKNMAYLCIGGSVAKDLLKSFYTRFFGSVVNEIAFKQAQQLALSHITGQITFGLASGVGRFLPVIGGLVNAGLDGITTYAAGRLACETFLF